MDWTDTLARLADDGLNAVGVADGAPYTRVLPGCRSILVVGSGGTRLWDRFVAHLHADPSALTDHLHPLDVFVRGRIAAADPDPAPDRRWIRCAADDGQDLDFRTLAMRAGLGDPSPLGLLLHPTFGPWMGLRAACFTTEALRIPPQPSSTSPCPACAAPCVSACPASAVRTEGAFDIGACAAFHRAPGPCETTCHSRRACPVGEDHRYSDLQHHYHAHRSSGRRRLAATLGAHADPHEGIGPHWDRAPNPAQ